MSKEPLDFHALVAALPGRIAELSDTPDRLICKALADLSRKLDSLIEGCLPAGEEGTSSAIRETSANSPSLASAVRR